MINKKEKEMMINKKEKEKMINKKKKKMMINKKEKEKMINKKEKKMINKKEKKKMINKKEKKKKINNKKKKKMINKKEKKKMINNKKKKKMINKKEKKKMINKKKKKKKKMINKKEKKMINKKEKKMINKKEKKMINKKEKKKEKEKEKMINKKEEKEKINKRTHRILLSVRMRNQLGRGLFCFIFTARVRLVRKVFWEGIFFSRLCFSSAFRIVNKLQKLLLLFNSFWQLSDGRLSIWRRLWAGFRLASVGHGSFRREGGGPTVVEGVFFGVLSTRFPDKSAGQVNPLFFSSAAQSH